MESGPLEPFGIWDPFRSAFGPEKEADSPKIIPQTHQKKLLKRSQEDSRPVTFLKNLVCFSLKLFGHWADAGEWPGR